jgi:hypothetical protein
MNSYLNDFDISNASIKHTLVAGEEDESYFCLETQIANRSLTSLTEIPIPLE